MRKWHFGFAHMSNRKRFILQVFLLYSRRMASREPTLSRMRFASSGLNNRWRFARGLSMRGLAGAGLSNVPLDLAGGLSMCGLAGGLSICGLAGDGLNFSPLISANGGIAALGKCMFFSTGSLCNGGGCGGGHGRALFFA